MLRAFSAWAESIRRKWIGLILIVTVPTQKTARDAEPMSFFSKIKSLFGQKPSFEVATGIAERLIELDFLKFVPESDQTNVRAQLVEAKITIWTVSGTTTAYLSTNAAILLTPRTSLKATWGNVSFR
jgi:hypothetical protein